MFSKCDWMIDIQKRRDKRLQGASVAKESAYSRDLCCVQWSRRNNCCKRSLRRREERIHAVLDRGSCDRIAGGERFRGSKVIRESAEEIEKVLFSHESRILTPGGGTISPGGAGPPASPSSGHYHPPTHSPPLVKVSDIPRFERFQSSHFSRIFSKRLTSFRVKDSRKKLYFSFQIVKWIFRRFLSCVQQFYAYYC